MLHLHVHVHVHVHVHAHVHVYVHCTTPVVIRSVHYTCTYMQVLVENSFRGFSGSLQQDSQEFLTALLERLHEELGAKVRNASEVCLYTHTQYLH